ncbi:MAG: Fic family protein [Schleiferiaceae bacterium]|nr:Fic family protein [Schleiferiaceae bacterium]
MNTFDKIEQFKTEWEQLQPLDTKDQKRLDEKLRLEFNYNSNHIEGNTLTYGETKLLLLFDDTKGGHTMREYEEMKAHDVAFKLIQEWAADQKRPLSEKDLKDLNEIMLVRPYWKEALTPDGQETRRQIKVGSYKEEPNSVRLPNGEIFDYASPEETPAQMGELMKWYREEETKLHPVTLAALFHYKFVRIHPFDDGNGRISRLLMNYVLLRNGYPPVVIKSEDKQKYLQALRRADVGNYEDFVTYIAEQVVGSLKLAIEAGKGNSIEEPDDLDKRLHLLERDLQQVNPDQTIQKEFSKEVFLEMYDSWIADLLKKAIPQVQKFNHFFTGVNHHVGVTNYSGQHFFNEEAAQIVESFKEKCIANQGEMAPDDSDLLLKTFYGSFIKAGMETFGCVYLIHIGFQLHTYTISVDHFTPTGQRELQEITKKLLHQPLPEKEQEELAQAFGNTIYQHIDYHTKKLGLR